MSRPGARLPLAALIRPPAAARVQAVAPAGDFQAWLEEYERKHERIRAEWWERQRACERELAEMARRAEERDRERAERDRERAERDREWERLTAGWAREREERARERAARELPGGSARDERTGDSA